MQETQAWSLGLKDALTEVMATPVFLFRKFHGQGSLAGYNPWGHRVWHNWATNIQITPNYSPVTLQDVGVCCVTLSCLTLCNSLDCSPPDPSVHHIFQSRILERVAISFSRGSSQSSDQTHISCIGRWILYYRATWESSRLVS